MVGAVILGDGILAASVRKALVDSAGINILSEFDPSVSDVADVCFVLAENEPALVSEDLRRAVGTAPSALVLCLAPLTFNDALAYESLCAELGTKAVCCAVLGPFGALGTSAATLLCAGDKDARLRVEPVTRALGGARSVGARACMAAVLAHASTGIHYVPLLSLLVGTGMCERYGLTLGEFVEKARMATPDLAQGAWRNICTGLADDRCFDDVDDDIHAMEMLVALLKRTGATDEVMRDTDRLRRLNHTLSLHWDALVAAVLGR